MAKNTNDPSAEFKHLKIPVFFWSTNVDWVFYETPFTRNGVLHSEASRSRCIVATGSPNGFCNGGMKTYYWRNLPGISWIRMLCDGFRCWGNQALANPCRHVLGIIPVKGVTIFSSPRKKSTVATKTSREAQNGPLTIKIRKIQLVSIPTLFQRRPKFSNNNPFLKEKY